MDKLKSKNPTSMYMFINYNESSCICIVILYIKMNSLAAFEVGLYSGGEFFVVCMTSKSLNFWKVMFRCKPMDAEDCEPYTDVYWIKYYQVDNARWFLLSDDFSFIFPFLH